MRLLVSVLTSEIQKPRVEMILNIDELLRLLRRLDWERCLLHLRYLWRHLLLRNRLLRWLLGSCNGRRHHSSQLWRYRLLLLDRLLTDGFNRLVSRRA